METPSGATTETNAAKPDGNGASNPGAESPPAATGTGENERIGELTANWRDSQRNVEHYRSRTEQLERELAEARGGGKARAANNDNGGEEADGDDEPIKTMADFNYDERKYGAYLRELGRKDAKAEADRVRTEIADGRTKAEKEAALQDFQEKAESWAKEQKLEDIEKMFAAPRDGGPTITAAMGEVIQASDVGPQVLHYLTKNKAECRRIAGLPPLKQALEIGRLESKFASGPAAATVSGAPPPPPQVKGASDTSAKKDPAQMTDAEWYAAHQRSNQARRAAHARK